ncbi:restriction endonuclease subunit S [Sharpea azabuensis]|uniref:restriction endonuclease subunit S n=1 Tax=Sharpea azabuensis TaxID=322505 RepID=UPI0015684BA6|nr:restriction endonuclease subunit S [Sharpea azabuensis]
MAREMKYSGIDYVGDVPSCWKVIPNKYIMKKKKCICDKWKNENVLSLTMNGVIIRDLINPVGKMPTTFDGYQYVYPNDLLMCLFDIDVTPRCVGIVKNFGVTSPAYTRFVLYDGYEIRYYYYYYLYLDNKKELLHLAKNLRHSFTEEELGYLKTPVPPLTEQQKIADFLDEKVKEIDNAIEKTKETIELYKKYKQAIITEAVTKGLDPNAEMKDSGVEWINQIPVKWNVNRLKNLFSFGKGLPITKADLKESGLPVISYGQIHSKTNSGVCVKKELVRFVSQSYYESNRESMTKKGDIIVADTSEDLEGCGNAVYINDDFNIFAGYHTVILKSKENKSNKYIAYLMKTDLWRSQIRTLVTSVKVFSITQSILKQCSVILPPKDSQEEIVDFLDDKCSSIDAIVNKMSSLIPAYENYKKSLIYEYVTGKKEVK